MMATGESYVVYASHRGSRENRTAIVHEAQSAEDAIRDALARSEWTGTVDVYCYKVESSTRRTVEIERVVRV